MAITSLKLSENTSKYQSNGYRHIYHHCDLSIDRN